MHSIPRMLLLCLGRFTNFLTQYGFSFFFIFTIVGCSILQADKDTAPEPKPTHQVQQKPEKKIPINHYQFGLSVNSKPIDGTVFGDGEDSILFIAAIHGDESAGIPLLRDLESYLIRNPKLLKGRKIVLLPVVNPDGVEQGTRENANGVDINHNFLSPTPEPETSAVLMALDFFKTQKIRIISLRQLDGIDFDGPEGSDAEALAYHMKEHCNLPINDQKTSPGSLGNYGELKGFSVITFGLPKDINPSDDVNIWNSFSKSIIAAIEYSPPDPASPETSSDVSEEDDFQKGILLFEKKEYWKASKVFKEVIKQNPGHDKARGYLSDCYFNIGQYFFNKNNYKKALRNFNVSYNYNNNCTECQKAKKKCNDMIQSLSKVDESPDTETEEESQPPEPVVSCSSLYNKALELFEAKNYSAAKNKFAESLECNDQCRECKKHLIFIDSINLFNNKKYLDAGTSFNKALAFDPENSIIPDNRKIKDLIKETYIKQIDEFHAEFDQAVKIFKGQNGYKQASAWFNKEEYANVLTWLEEKHFSDKANQHLKLARQYGKKCGKCRLYEDSIKEKIYNEGKKHREKEQLVEAIGNWETLINIDPTYGDVKSRLNEAKTVLKQLLKVLSDK